jgi:hemolysin activation/secretion protein
LRKKRQSLTFSAGYNNKYAKSYSFNELENIDDLDVFNVNLEYDSLDKWSGKNLISLGYYWGSLNPGEKPFTRKTAEHRFRKVYLSAVRIQNVWESINFMLKAAGQVSNQNLLPIEQMAIGGYGSVRGHDTSLFLGDKGFTLSGELIAAPPYLADKILWDQRIKQMVQLALFFDYGRVYLTDPGHGEYNDERLKGHGVGLRLYYKDIFSFKFDIARPTKKKAIGEDSTVFYFFGNINLTSEEMPKLLRKIRNLWGGDDELEE